MTETEADPTHTRLDIWLWRARFFKTRRLSTDWITKRGIRVTRAGQTRKIHKAGTHICIGDVLTFGKTMHIRTVEVLEIGTRRGPAKEAELLYQDLA
mgnify:CR=1 FL=1